MFGLEKTIIDGIKESLSIVSACISSWKHTLSPTGPVTTLRDLVVQVPTSSDALIALAAVARTLSRRTMAIIMDGFNLGLLYSKWLTERS